ncbi:helicase-related protein [Candidatus Amarolinea dominans]|uniref:DEAD/DEAH box helicase n=1 Tax=Candidatus Amarolinea dominans TaxID=3140696 RepID=UPI0031CCB48C
MALGILAESLADQDARAIVFHESIEAIENLFLQALQRKIPAVLEHSQLPDGLRAENIEAFREGVARVIISAKSLVEGFNVPSADLGIIAASSSSVRQRIQSLGRMLRRKPGDRSARVFVLYVRDTEDEAIYEKADWENVIGAERNQYFIWRPGDEGTRWPEGLEVSVSAPRTYRPPSWEVDVAGLAPQSPYPGQTRARGAGGSRRQPPHRRWDSHSCLTRPRGCNHPAQPLSPRQDHAGLPSDRAYGLRWGR